MGGLGSGNWCRFDSKTLAEHYLFIDVRQLSRSGCLVPGKRFDWQWRDGCNILIEIERDSIDLLYAISHDSQREDVHINVLLSWSSCNYGGKRPWFICPGKGCGRRVAKLYLGRKYFLCRHCHELAYSSQREGKEFRMMNRAQKICQRLGANNCDDLFNVPRPKGMHRRTYETLCDKAEELDFESLLTIFAKFNQKVIQSKRE